MRHGASICRIHAAQPPDGGRDCNADATTSSHEPLRSWLSWPDPDQTVAQSEDLARACRAAYLTNRDYTLGVWSPERDRLLGGTGFHLRSRPVGDQVAEIGMWICEDAAGRGLGTVVLGAMLRWGFTDWPWERLSWHCDERNVASKRTAERAGMSLEGALRGDKPEVGEGRRTTLIYELTRADQLTG